MILCKGTYKKGAGKTEKGENNKAKVVVYYPGNLVMSYCPRRASNKSIKLARLFKGPYRVINQLSHYVVRKIGMSRSGRQVHVNSMKELFS